MSMEDPFFVVKGEVQKAVNTAQSLHQRWSELLQDPATASKEEVDWTTNELRNSLSIVESNPRKFNLDTLELNKRKAFIASTRQTVKEMKDSMSSPMAQVMTDKNRQIGRKFFAIYLGLIMCTIPFPFSQTLLGDSGLRGPVWQSATDKYSRLDRELQTANSQFIEEQQSQQQLIAEQQDEQLELVSGSIGVLKNMSQRIGQELDEQAVMLDDFSHEMDNTQSRLDNVMKKLAKVSHMTSDRRQWCAIGVLLAILFVVLILFFVL
ncbi:syntaxin-6-like [Scleropages formosus]|uniref:Syntaxin-6-like n=1 Tax=Scleropages formosus TaxID=113540 RepID=A0A0P7UPB9_SCLFO|nr:syntaxin-6-like [Scleropages formosus]